MINNQGQQVARYDKIHLFDANISDKKSNYQESLDYSAGSCAVLVDTPVGRLGLTICYDIRFPELYLNLRQGGVLTSLVYRQPLLKLRVWHIGKY